ncbi:MAG: hypothetical protein JWO09_1195 [Bacteroidetes bacterium]|nr:hypothetical protein [Bacteroidota bacterium]
MITENPTSSLEKIFSGASFKNLDQAALVKQFDISPQLRKNNSAAKPAAAYVPQVGPDISNIPSGGIIINQPGQYRFLNDITWAPAGAGAAILVLANDVVLDLKGFTLTVNAPGPNAGTQYNGISLGISDKGVTTVNAVTLQNGTVNGASYYGVSAMQTTNLQISNITVGNISYNETATANLTACGIFIDSSDVFNVQNCIVQNITVMAPSCAGIQILSSTNGNVSGCTMKQFVNSDGGVQGFSYLKSSNITTNACISENFRSHYRGQTDTTGHTVIGYVPIFCNDLEYNDCSADGMTGCCDDCHGMSVFLNSYVQVNNFSATNVIDGACSVNTGAKATGLEVYGDYITINNCTSSNIKAIVPQDLQSAGFSAWGTNITFNNCVATDVLVLDANQQPSTQYGYGVGFGWAPDPRTVFNFNSTPAHLTQYNNCNANNCQVGFDTWFHTNSQWNNVMTQDCPIFILAEKYGTPRTLSMDKCSESPSGEPVSVTITNIAADNTFPQLHV